MVCDATHSADELHAQYACIFPTGNRNAASHRWAAHLLAHAPNMNTEEFDAQARAFCATSGSIVRGDRGSVLDLATTRGDRTRVFVPHCCWPCACDVQDANDAGRLLVHTAPVTTDDGVQDVHHLVMADPCASDTFRPPANAPELRCVDGAMEGAHSFSTSQGPMIVIGFAFSTPEPNSHPSDRCEQRAATGYQSGMGSMFREVVGL